jgi:hypothetical protein
VVKLLVNNSLRIKIKRLLAKTLLIILFTILMPNLFGEHKIIILYYAVCLIFLKDPGENKYTIVNNHHKF